MILDKTSLEVMILVKTSLEVIILDKTSLEVMILDKTSLEVMTGRNQRWKMALRIIAIFDLPAKNVRGKTKKFQILRFLMLNLDWWSNG